MANMSDLPMLFPLPGSMLEPLPGMHDIDLLLADVGEDAQVSGAELFDTFFGTLSAGLAENTAAPGKTTRTDPGHSTKERKPRHRKSRKRAAQEDKVAESGAELHRPCKGAPVLLPSLTAIPHH